MNDVSDKNDYSLEGIKKIDPDKFSLCILDNFIKHYGIENITTYELNEFAKHFNNMFLYDDAVFWKYYQNAANRENAKNNDKLSKRMFGLTIATVVLTIVQIVITIIQLLSQH